MFAASFGDDPERERALVEAFTRRRVDGLILTTISADQSYLQTERDQGMPMVFVDRPPTRAGADTVLTNNHEASVAASPASDRARTPADRLPQRRSRDVHGPGAAPRATSEALPGAGVPTAACGRHPVRRGGVRGGASSSRARTGRRRCSPARTS